MEKLKVLIPTDFSVQAEFAYLMVKNMQEKIDMDIHFLHVLDVPDTVTLNEKGHIETCGEIDTAYVQSKKEIAERNLRNLKQEYGSHIHTHLLLGKAPEKIIYYTNHHKFDLIVMGTKGAWGIKEKLSGTNTQVVARQSRIPVLSLMCDRSELNIDNILLVHDFNTAEKEDMKLLDILIRAFNPKIHFLHITDSETDNLWILSQMDTFAKVNNVTNYEKHLLADADIVNGVTHFNQMQEMVIVYIGTHGRKGVQRVINPSATEKLINHLIKPIISFHLTHN